MDPEARTVAPLPLPQISVTAYTPRRTGFAVRLSIAARRAASRDELGYYSRWVRAPLIDTLSKSRERCRPPMIASPAPLLYASRGSGRVATRPSQRCPDGPLTRAVLVQGRQRCRAGWVPALPPCLLFLRWWPLVRRSAGNERSHGHCPPLPLAVRVRDELCQRAAPGHLFGGDGAHAELGRGGARPVAIHVGGVGHACTGAGDGTSSADC